MHPTSVQTLLRPSVGFTNCLHLPGSGQSSSPQTCYDFLHSIGPMHSDEPLDTDELPYQDEPPVFNPTLYPRTYKASTGYLLFLGVASFLCALGGIAGIIYFGTGHEMT